MWCVRIKDKSYFWVLVGKIEEVLGPSLPSWKGIRLHSRRAPAEYGDHRQLQHLFKVKNPVFG